MLHLVWARFTIIITGIHHKMMLETGTISWWICCVWWCRIYLSKGFAAWLIRACVNNDNRATKANRIKVNWYFHWYLKFRWILKGYLFSFIFKPETPNSYFRWSEVQNNPYLAHYQKLVFCQACISTCISVEVYTASKKGKGTTFNMFLWVRHFNSH